MKSLSFDEIVELAEQGNNTIYCLDDLNNRYYFYIEREENEYSIDMQDEIVSSPRSAHIAVLIANFLGVLWCNWHIDNIVAVKNDEEFHQSWILE